MKNLKRLFILTLSLMMIFSLTAFANDNKIEEKIYTIKEAYQYPVVPGMPEWSKFNSLDEMIEACQIPKDILSNMSTDALIETVINYPLAINMFAFDNPQKGFDSVNSYFNGFQELGNRPDAIQKMNLYTNSISYMKNYDQMDSIIASVIFENLKFQNNIEKIELLSETHYNYTPKGTKVQFIYNLTWADHGLTSTQADNANENFKKAYPNATPLREENPSYNCHSYAWYSTSLSNLYWLNGNYAYMYISDGSYSRTYSPSIGNKVWYGSADHSAIYAGSSIVKSKWGSMGLYQHNVSYCPYSSSDVSYWK